MDEWMIGGALVMLHEKSEKREEFDIIVRRRYVARYLDVVVDLEPTDFPITILSRRIILSYILSN